MFKVIRSNTEIAITLPRTARLHSNLVQSFRVSPRHRQYTTNVPGQRLKVTVTA